MTQPHVLIAGQRARIAAKKRGRLQISSALPAIAAAAADAAGQGLFSVDVSMADPWFLDKTNQRDLRRILKTQDLYAVNPRVEDGKFVISVAWGDFPPEESLSHQKAQELSKAVILVVGGTSQVGRAALNALSAYTDLYTIKATSRSSPSSEVAQATPHVTWVECDLSKESLTTAFQGVQKVFYVMPPVENKGELGRNLAAALAASNVQYVVDQSVIGAPSKAILFARQAREQEEAVEACGVNWTHLRLGVFMENILFAAPAVRQGILPLAYGQAEVALVSVIDAGSAAARLLTRLGAEGVAVDLTGPAPLTGASMATVLASELNRQVEYEALSEPVTIGAPAWMAEGMVEIHSMIQNGHAANVTKDGPALLAGRMTAFPAWAHAHRQAFL